MAVQLTNDQFEQMLTRLVGVRQEGAVGQDQGGGRESNAAVIGPMQPCILGVDKTRRLKTFEDWLRECQVKMDFMNITNEGRKIALIRSWAGPDLTNFWDREGKRMFTLLRLEPAFSHKQHFIVDKHQNIRISSEGVQCIFEP